MDRRLRLETLRKESLCPQLLQLHADALLVKDGDFAREPRDFSRIELINASPIVAAEAEDFF